MHPSRCSFREKTTDAEPATIPATANASESVFGYDANLPMAWIAGIVLSISTLFHIYQYFKRRSIYFYLFLLGIFSGSLPRHSMELG
jgi:hypothetical protein